MLAQEVLETEELALELEVKCITRMLAAPALAPVGADAVARALAGNGAERLRVRCGCRRSRGHGGLVAGRHSASVAGGAGGSSGAGGRRRQSDSSVSD